MGYLYYSCVLMIALWSFCELNGANGFLLEKNFQIYLNELNKYNAGYKGNGQQPVHVDFSYTTNEYGKSSLYSVRILKSD